tara:strand:- start:41 stop:493 length:453 start_codon:yes stop_codon:yes gene_type:complete
MNKELWGNTVWYLFHTIAEKIKEEEFLNNKNSIIEIIKSTCFILPCPECSNHATNILKTINFTNMTTKEELKTFLFNFHNDINKKLGKPIYNIENLNIYKNANFNIITNNFKIILSQNSNVPQLMNYSFKRQKSLPNILTHINNIIPHMQ